MPEKRTLKRAASDKRRGKSASTQAGEFVKEEMDHIREGKHGARSAKQAIAIGLSKARRSGVKLAAPKHASASTRKKAAHDLEAGAKAGSHHVSAKRSHATSEALEHEGHRAASKTALSRHAHSAAAHRTKADRSRSARKAAATRKRAG